MPVLETEFQVSGVEEVIRALQEHMRVLRETHAVTEDMVKEYRELTKPFYMMRRELTAIRTVWRAHHAALLEGIRVFRQMGYIGREVMNMWQGYTLGMIRVERAQRDVEEASRDVAFWQDVYNRYVRDFGEESVYAQEALRHLKDAMEAEKDAIERAQQAHKDMGVLWASMGLDAVTFAGNIAMIAEALVTLKASLAGVALSLSSIASAIPPIAVLMGMVAGSFVLASKEVEVQNKGLAELSNTMVHFEEHARGVINALHEHDNAFRYAQQHVEEYKGAVDSLFKRSPLPELNLWLKRTRESLKDVSIGFDTARDSTERFARSIPQIRHVSVIQYNTIAGDLDMDRIAHDAYRKLMRRLEQAW
jgi:hypothetical protein